MVETVSQHPVGSSAAKRGLGRVTLYADGASRGNPGPAAIGVVLALLTLPIYFLWRKVTSLAEQS